MSGQDGSRLALGWSGAAGARLTVTLDRPSGAGVVLVRDRRLAEGIQLVDLPVDGASEGTLHIDASDEAGGRLAESVQSLDGLRGTSSFAWESVFHGPGVDDGDQVNSGGVSAMLVWDDGTGPALYIGGGFLTAGAGQVTRIARWNGSEWSALAGPDGTGVSIAAPAQASVKALAVFQGELVVAGFFDTAGGLPVSNIARWNGSAWSPMGPGLSGSVGVQSLAVYGDALIAGGYFTQSGDRTVNRIARWDGAAWSSLGGGISGAEFNQEPSVGALAVYHGDLVAGGNFLQAGNTGVNRIARWDGTAWSSLGGGVGDASNPAAELPSVRALAVYGDDLVAGGNFTTAGGQSARLVARWNGTTWSPLGGGMDGEGNVSVRALALRGSELIAAGNFTLADGTMVNNIARWNGSTWSALAGTAGTGTNGGISTLGVFGGDLVVGGPSASFTQAGGVVARSLARWNGSEWSTLSGLPGTGVPGPGIAGRINAMTVYGGALVVGGAFTYAGSQIVHNVARWDGSAWSPLGPAGAAGVDGLPGAGVTPEVDALAVYGSDLVVAGRFLVAGTTGAKHIARWNGSTWSALGAAGSGVDGSSAAVKALMVDGSGLVAAGRFTVAGGTGVNNIARWNGSAWSALGAGVNDEVDALAAYGGAVIAGGFFTSAGSTSASAIARWDGTAWSPLAGGLNGIVLALGVFDGDLIAGGNFSRANGMLANRIARWDGSQWSALGAGVDANVQAMTSYAGTLIVGGSFVHAGGRTVNGVASWDGTAWAPLAGPAGIGVGGYALAGVTALAAYDPDGAGSQPEKLAAGGQFNLAGGVADWSLALYGPAASQGNLVLTPRDVGFGDVIVGDSAVQQTVTLSSLGNVPVTVNAIDAVAAPFVAGSSTCPAAPFTLAPGAGCTLSFGFAPASTGDFQQALAVATDAGGTTVNLAGRGVPLPPPSISAAPGSFTVTVTRGEAVTQPLTLRNLGGEALEWSFDTAGSGGCDALGAIGWLGANPASGSIPRGGSVTVTLTFDASSLASGSYDALPCVASNDPAQASLQLPVDLAVTPRPATIDLDPDSVSAVVPSGGSLTQTLAVANLGDAALDWAITQETSRQDSAAGTPDTPPGLNGDANAAVVWDDGHGPALYVAGAFTTADGVTVNRVARWNGRAWSALGSGLDRTASSLAVYDGALYVGGAFSQAGGVAANKIARWDGSHWSALGSGIDGGSTVSVNALAAWGTRLVAAGNFTAAAGTTVNYVAAWDGTQWTSLGSGLDGQATSLVAYGGDLVVGGVFDAAGGHAASGIARWNGSQWAPLGAGLDSVVLTLGLYNGDLIAGGSFSNAGGVPASRIARWNGSSWSALGSGINTQVGALAVYGSQLAVGGLFSQAGGQSAANVALWNGSAWSATGTGTSARVSSLAVFHGTLVAGGSFHQAGGVGAERIARWDGSAWSPLSPEPIDCALPAWITAAPAGGSLDAGANQQVTLDFEASGVAAGNYTANLCFTSNDASQPLVVVPVALSVTASDGSTVWTGGTGDWFASGNWSAGVPGTDIPAHIDNGGTAQVSAAGALAQTLILGFGASDSGALEASGAGTLDIASDLAVGYGGDGTLAIGGGARVSNYSGEVGYSIDSSGGASGTATVDGAGSLWANTYELYVGYGTGTLNISNGGAVSDYYGYLGYYPEFPGHSSGTANVDGSGSTWTHASTFSVGRSGSGVLNITNGGGVVNGDGYLGYDFGSDGTATVDGPGSSWTTNGFLYVGNDGNGALHVSGGGRVDSNGSYGYVGYGASSAAGVTVDGSGSVWSNAHGLYVGFDGAGTLAVSSGGAVTNGSFANIGFSTGASGTLVVSGAGSDFETGGTLAVGGNVSGPGGTGTLHLADGGHVGAAALKVWNTGTVAFTLAPAAGGGVGVSGAATLGGTLSVDFTSGVFDAGSYTLLQADGGFDGSAFASVNVGAPPSGFDAAVTYDASHVYLVLTPKGGGALRVDPPAVDFGTVPAGIVAGPATMTLTNTGSTVASVSAIDSATAPFVRKGGDCPVAPFALAAGASCTLAYAFEPTRTGPFGQTFHVGSDVGNTAFTLSGTGVAGPPSQLILLGGSGQSAMTGSPFALPLAVEVRDDWNNPVPDIQVTFDAPAQGASAVLSATTATTDANGYASVTAVANATAGSYSVGASGGLGTPVAFALTNTAAALDVGVAIVADRDHVRAGGMLDYVITLHNAGSAATTAGAALASTLSPLLDHGAASWICLSPPESGCTASGTGDLAESGLVLAPGASVSYLLSAPVRLDAEADMIETAVVATLAGDGNPANDTAIVRTPLVIFRDGFEAYGDGSAVLEAQDGTLVPGGAIDFAWPGAGSDPVDAVLRADSAAGGFRVEQLNDGRESWLRLLASPVGGAERAGAWVRIATGAEVHLVLLDGDESDPRQRVRVSGAGTPVELPLPAGSTGYRLLGAMPLMVHPPAG